MYGIAFLISQVAGLLFYLASICSLSQTLNPWQICIIQIISCQPFIEKWTRSLGCRNQHAPVTFCTGMWQSYIGTKFGILEKSTAPFEPYINPITGKLTSYPYASPSLTYIYDDPNWTAERGNTWFTAIISNQNAFPSLNFELSQTE